MLNRLGENIPGKHTDDSSSGRGASKTSRKQQQKAAAEGSERVKVLGLDFLIYTYMCTRGRIMYRRRHRSSDNSDDVCQLSDDIKQ